MRKYIVGIFAGLLLLKATVAVSNEPLGDLRTLSIEELMNLEVVSSTQQQVRLPETPSSVYVVTGDQIRRWGIRRLSELVDRLVPGAVSAEDFDDEILGFRGVTADNNLKVLLLFNGHDYNTQWNNGPTSEVELGLMDDISKVEVLIGPHSAVYGSGALIGVVNIITKSGADFSGVRASGSVGSGDYKRGELIAGAQPNSDLNYFFSMGGLAAEGYENNNNEPLNINRFPLSWKFYGNVNYKKFELMSRFTRSSRAFFIQKSSDTTPNLWTNYDTFFIDARRTFQIKPDFKCILNFNFDSIETQRHDFTLGTKLRAVGENRYGTKFTAFYSGWRHHDFLTGFTYRRDEFGDDWSGDNFNFSTVIEPDGTVSGIPSDPYSVRTLTPYGRNVYGFFGQDTISLGNRYSLLFGFRFDRIEAPQIPEPNSFTPRVALVYKPNQKAVLKAMFTSGLSRQPNAAVVSPDSFAFGRPLSTEITKPEHMYSYELAGSYHVKPALDLSLNIFYNSLRDLFGNPPGNSQVLITAGRIDYTGFEAVATMNLSENSLVRVTHQFVRLGSVVNDPVTNLTTPDGGNHPVNYPEDETKLLAEWQPIKQLNLNANANLIWNNYGEKASHTVETGFYSTVNMNAVWNLSGVSQLQLSIYNLFNTRKQIPPFDYYAYLAERNVNISFNYWF
jgi:outer membrane receptor protein involved in Fe transport